MDWLRRQSESAPERMRDTIAQMLMNAEVEGICGVGYGWRGAERQNSRNAYLPRTFDTRRNDGAVHPEAAPWRLLRAWLLEPRRRAERDLTSAIAEAYLLGVSPGESRST